MQMSLFDIYETQGIGARLIKGGFSKVTVEINVWLGDLPFLYFGHFESRDLKRLFSKSGKKKDHL